MSFLNTKSKGVQSHYLDCVRQVAPQIADKQGSESVKTGRFREKLMRRKKDIFGNEVTLIREALERRDKEVATKWKFHITTGAREGGSDSSSGLVGIKFENFKGDFSRVDDYESKVRGGIYWRDCPVDLFFRELPSEIKALWISRGRPANAKLFEGGYKEVIEMYKRIRAILEEEYEGEVEPSLLKEFESLRPHDADKIHVNLLWEAEVPLEVVGGQFLGGSEGLGLMGRGWLDLNVIKKYYLSMTARSERFKKIRESVAAYVDKLNGRIPSELLAKIWQIIREGESSSRASPGLIVSVDSMRRLLEALLMIEILLPLEMYDDNDISNNKIRLTLTASHRIGSTESPEVRLFHQFQNVNLRHGHPLLPIYL